MKERFTKTSRKTETVHRNYGGNKENPIIYYLDTRSNLTQ